MRILDPRQKANDVMVRTSTMAMLMDAVGEHDFIDRIHGALCSLMPIARIGAFAYDECARPVKLLPTSVGAAQVKPHEVARYKQTFFRHDDVPRILSGNHDGVAVNAPITLVVREVREIQDASYRQAYVSSGLVQRLAIVAPHPAAGGLSLNLYRSAEAGEFSSTELTVLSGLASLLIKCARLHLRLCSPPGGRDLEECRRRLAEIDPTMPKRELEVCTLLLKGLTVGEIAKDLGIMPSSVVTYRRRSYERLGVANCKELMTRCF